MVSTINYEEGIDGVRKLLLCDAAYGFDKVYYSSNEDLGALFSSVDMKDKDVLTVQASSDQLFYISGKEPASIETFDINRLTKYYYYLRKWYILYKDKYYFDIYDTLDIHNLLEEVIPVDEEEYDAYKYWDTFVRTIPRFFIKDLFFVSVNPHKNKISDLEKLKDFLVDYKLRFTGMDISREKINKKYDTIVISNILEYYDENRDRIDNIRDNLYGMLNDGGEVIATNFMNDFISFTIFNSFHELFSIREIFNNRDGIGCVYKKVLTKNS